MYAKSFVLYKVIDYLYDKVATEAIAEWIDHLEPVYVTDRQFVLYVSDDAFRNAFSQQYTSLINEALSNCFSDLMRLELWDDDQMEAYRETQRSLGPFNPDYTFDRFVKNETNKEAFESAYLFSKDRTGVDLLCIQGPRNSGKTHLVTAVAHQEYQRSQRNEIILTNSDNFTGELIQALRRGETNIPDRFLNAHLLIIEDVQFLSNKPTVLDELVYLLRNRLAEGKKSCITSDRDVSGLSPKLSELTNFGYTVTIQE